MPRRLAAELAVAVGGQHHLLEQRLEVPEAQEGLRRAHEGRRVDQQPPHEGDPEAVLRRAVELLVVDALITKAADRVADLLHRRPLAVGDLEQAADAIFLNPALDPRQDLLAGHMLRRELEGALAEQHGLIEEGLALRLVDLSRLRAALG
jgi:hypothetical protein